MINRYTTPEMDRIWSDQNRFEIWKKVELAVKNVIQNMEVKNKDALINPEALDYFQDIAELNT